MTFEGNNSISLNSATMQKAVEHWLNEKVLQEDIQVTAITKDSASGTYAVVFTRPVKETK